MSDQLKIYKKNTLIYRSENRGKGSTLWYAIGELSLNTRLYILLFKIMQIVVILSGPEPQYVISPWFVITELNIKYS